MGSPVIAAVFDWLFSPMGNVFMLAVIVIVLPAWGWKLTQDAVNPRDRERRP